MEKLFDIILRCVAVFFTLSAIAIAVYGICILRFDALIMAALWYFICGGLAVQSLKDMKEMMTGGGNF